MSHTYEAALESLQSVERREEMYRGHSAPIVPFLVRMTARVVIRHGGVAVEVLEPGDVLVATARNDRSEYYVASPVSVYYHEAEVLELTRDVEDHVAMLGYN